MHGKHDLHLRCNEQELVDTQAVTAWITSFQDLLERHFDAWNNGRTSEAEQLDRELMERMDSLNSGDTSDGEEVMARLILDLATR